MQELLQLRRNESEFQIRSLRRNNLDGFPRWADEKFHDYAVSFTREAYKKMGVMTLVMGVRVQANGSLAMSV